MAAEMVQVGASDAERGRLLERLEEVSQPEWELAALRLVRAEVAALEERVDHTRQVGLVIVSCKMLRCEML
eukprot:3934280-Rhodomonas_salina.1